MPDVKLTIDGKQVTAAPGTLVIDAAKTVGIEIPSFCYYEGLSLQAACRMCLVEVEKMPKLMTACTLPVSEGMVVRTDTAQVHAARKYMLEFLLSNHPLDCPVCDKGGECELQDMTFRYGVGESRFTEEKVHTPEKQYSPVVFYDAPRCILCYRCVRICDEGIGRGRARRNQPRRGFRDRPESGRSPGVRRVRRLHRYLPRGCAHQRHLPLSDAPVGDDPRGHDLHALRRWLQDYAGHAQRPHSARQQPRYLRDQRRVPVHQGALRVRFLRSPGQAPGAAGSQERKAGRSLLVGSAEHRGAEVQRDAGRRRRFRRDRLQPHFQRRELLSSEIRPPGSEDQQH